MSDINSTVANSSKPSFGFLAGTVLSIESGVTVKGAPYNRCAIEQTGKHAGKTRVVMIFNGAVETVTPNLRQGEPTRLFGTFDGGTFRALKMAPAKAASAE